MITVSVSDGIPRLFQTANQVNQQYAFEANIQSEARENTSLGSVLKSILIANIRYYLRRFQYSLVVAVLWAQSCKKAAGKRVPLQGRFLYMQDVSQS